MNIIKTGRKTGCARQAIWPNRAAQNVFFVEALVCPINHPLTHILSLPYPYTFPPTGYGPTVTTYSSIIIAIRLAASRASI